MEGKEGIHHFQSCSSLIIDLFVELFTWVSIRINCDIALAAKYISAKKNIEMTISKLS